MIGTCIGLALARCQILFARVCFHVRSQSRNLDLSASERSITIDVIGLRRPATIRCYLVWCDDCQFEPFQFMSSSPGMDAVILHSSLVGYKNPRVCLCRALSFPLFLH